MPEPATPRSDAAISKRLVLLLAFTCGAAAANLYYAQPLLHTIGGTFGVSNGTAGLLVTASQVGYALGLAFLVPLGDLLERSRLIVAMLVVCGIGQGAAAVAQGFGVFSLALAVVGLTSAVAQIIVPMSSSLAAALALAVWLATERRSWASARLGTVAERG
jgi:predicted MFS family arabinose efflux permease